MPIKLIKKLWSSSFHRNAVYLMAATVVNTGLGFVFWTINSRLFGSEEIGLAIAAISAMQLIASISLLGLDAGLIRFLPESKEKNDMISTCFTMGGLFAIIVSFIFLIGLNIWSPGLLFLRQDVVFGILFILFTSIWTLYLLLPSVFLAWRRADLIFVRATIYMLVKIFVPFLLISFGVIGIFAAWGIASLIGLFIGIFLFIQLVYSSYRPKPMINKNIIRKMTAYSSANYIAGVFNTLPIVLMPLIIVNMFGGRFATYYYYPMMIANLLFMISIAVGKSLFAEGSNFPEVLDKTVKKAMKFVFAILIPCAFLLAIVDNKILLLFGSEISENARGLLQLFVIGGIPRAFNNIYITKLKVEKRIKSLILLRGLGAILILIISYFLMLNFGLIGIGYGMLIGHLVVSGLIGADWIRLK